MNMDDVVCAHTNCGRPLIEHGIYHDPPTPEVEATLQYALHTGFNGMVCPAPKREWVVGFAFTTDATEVVLIRKNRPEWQAGKLNGVGGKVDVSDRRVGDSDPRDCYLIAMAREFWEETGVSTTGDAWHHFASLTWEEGVVHFLRLFDTQVAVNAKTATDEDVRLYDVARFGLRTDTTPNLLWLVPLAAHRHDTYDLIDVIETGTTLRKPGRLGIEPGSPFEVHEVCTPDHHVTPHRGCVLR